jgi:GT2 family glycosyltransferase
VAKHEWIAFLDSDDEWLPHKLERQCEALERHPQYRFCHTDEIWIRRGRRVNPMKKHAKHRGYIFDQCLPLCVISPSSALIHRDLFDRYGTFDPELPVCEDYDLWLRICAREPVLYVDEALLLKFGGHEDQLSQAYWGMDRFRIRALENLIRSGALDGAALAGPCFEAECILQAELDLRQIAEESMTLDVSGHYARPDVFSLTVNRSRPGASDAAARD